MEQVKAIKSYKSLWIDFKANIVGPVILNFENCYMSLQDRTLWGRRGGGGGGGGSSCGVGRAFYSFQCLGTLAGFVEF